MKIINALLVSGVLLFFSSCKKESSSAAKEPAWLKQDLLAYYPLNGNAKDSSGNGYDGIVNGAVLDNDRNNRANGAYNFVNGEIISNLGDPNFKGNFSVTLWSRLETFNYENEPGRISYPLIISSGIITNNTLNAFLGLHYSNSNPIILQTFLHAPNNYYFTYAPVDFKSWNHISIINKSDTLSLFLNGNFVSRVSNPKPQNPLYSSSFIRFGFPKGALYELYRLNGKLDDIRIYKRALTAEEVKYLYQN
jgi:hypothetical protein